VIAVGNINNAFAWDVVVFQSCILKTDIRLFYDSKAVLIDKKEGKGEGFAMFMGVQL